MAEINNETPIKIPKKDERLAELVGIILGDGSIYKSKERSMYELRIAGHSIDDKEYLINYVGSLIEELFGIKVRLYFFKNKKCLHIKAQGVRLISYLEKIGLISGNKVKNDVGIPQWILDSKEFTKCCIRGLIDTDGGVYDCGNGSLFPRIGFCSYIPQLRNDFRNSLLNLGFFPLKWIMKTKTAIYRKKEVFRYIEEIGFSNPKHIKRLKMLLDSNAPVV